MLTILALVSNSRPANEPIELDPGIITLLSNLVRAFRDWRQPTRKLGAKPGGQRHRPILSGGVSPAITNKSALQALGISPRPLHPDRQAPRAGRD
jgi:hypothetical protein